MLLYRVRVVDGAVIMSWERKKAMKKQRRSQKKKKTEKWVFVARSGV
jgi:hypothetical protein